MARRKIPWTDEALNMLDRMWCEGFNDEEVAIALEPLLGRLVSASAVRQASTRRQLTRSPEAIALAHRHRSEAQHVRQKERREAKLYELASPGFVPTDAPDTEPPKQQSEPSVPYQGLCTRGRDPRQIIYLRDLEQRRRS